MSVNSNHLAVPELLSAVEGTPLPESAQDHLSQCSECAENVASLVNVSRTFGSPPRIELSDTLRARILKAHADAHKTGNRSSLRTFLTCKVPLYQVAGFAMFCILLWQLIIPMVRRAHQENDHTPPSFIIVAGESLIGP